MSTSEEPHRSPDMFSSMDVQFPTQTQQSLDLFSDIAEEGKDTESVDIFSSPSSDSVEMETENPLPPSQIDVENSPKAFIMKLFLESHFGDAITIRDPDDEVETVLGSPVE